MKNLKSLQNQLLEATGAKALSSKEKKLIKGGYYSSYEECMAECQAGTGGGFPNSNWNSWGGSPSGCYEDYPGNWDCRDS